MIKKQKKLLFILGIFLVFSLVLVADPFNLSIINQEETILGSPLSKGDLLIFISLFGTIVAVVTFFYTGKWKQAK